MIFIKDVKSALEWFAEKRIIIFPTETVYGLGAVAHEEVHVKKIYALKNRNPQNPLIIHFSSLEEIKKYCLLNALEEKLVKNFTPGPLSILLRKKHRDIFSAATGLRPQLCARIPQEPFALKLIETFGPIAAPSCNKSTELTITNTHMISNTYAHIDIGVYINDQIVGGLESTIIEVNPITNEVQILREGLISEEKLQSLDVNIKINKNPSDTKPMVPGAYFLHYQISKPLYIQSKKLINSFHIGWGLEMCDFNLSPTNNPQEVIKNYFYSLFLGDKSNFPIVTITPLSLQIYKSLNERLKKTLRKE